MYAPVWKVEIRKIAANFDKQSHNARMLHFSLMAFSFTILISSFDSAITLLHFSHVSVFRVVHWNVSHHSRLCSRLLNENLVNFCTIPMTTVSAFHSKKPLHICLPKTCL